MSIFIHLLAISLLLILTIRADEYSRNDFPPTFIFGSASSAYQVEGAANEDGRSPGIWDTFAHAGYMNGENGDVACDGYHKYMEDVQLMVDTGLDAYRFSISWSRLIPKGRGPVNPKGLQYYNNLVNELVSQGIQPHVTLHHYDFPQVLEDEYEGWLDQKVVKDFTAYADVCFKEFGDRVRYWNTMNEANIYTLGGYDSGFTPPRRCTPTSRFNCSKGNSSTEPYVAAHNMLLAHASAARLYEQKYKEKQRGYIGISLFAYGIAPLTNSEEDAIAAQRYNDFSHGWFLHPLVFGDYPEIMKKNVGSRMPEFTDQESKTVKGAFDFLGLIHYLTVYVKDNSASLNQKRRDFSADTAVSVSFINSSSFTQFPIIPWGLKEVLEYIKETYDNPPIYILENGQGMWHNSSLEDTLRVKYLHSYIGALLDAVRNGSNTRGYFQWSFLDLFELLTGYEATFGLFYVDFKDPDLKRSPKYSAHWYSHFLKGGTVSSDGVIKLHKNLSATVSDGRFSQ